MAVGAGPGLAPWDLWATLSSAYGGGYSCLENLKVRGAWRATIHKVAKSWTRLKQFSMHKGISVVAVWRMDFRGHKWNLRDKE